MRKIVVMALLLVAAAFGAASAAVAPMHGGAQGGHGPTTNSAPVFADRGLIEVIKGATLSNYRGLKVGDAFDGYSHFKVKEWREARGAAGTIYVDYYGFTPTGLLDVKGRMAGIASKGIVVKFVIYPNGEYGVVMVTKTVVMKDGKSSATPVTDIKSVVDAIYRNVKLDL